MSRVLTLAALAFAVAAPAAGQPAGQRAPPPARRSPPAPEQRGPIRVGVVTDSYPYSFTEGGDRSVGFAVDLLAAIEQAMGLRLERVYGPTDVINRSFERGDLDMLQTYAEAASREMYADFSVPYLSMAGSIFARRDVQGITRLQDLKGRRVLVHPGGLGEQLLQSAGLGDSVVHVPSVEEAFRQLEQGRGDATLATRLTGLMAIERAGLTLIVAVGEPVPGYNVRYAFAVRDGDRQLLARLNEGLAILERTGHASAIYGRWFSAVESRRYSPFAIAMAVAGGLAVALLVAVWSMLRQRALADRLRKQEEQMHRAQKLEAIGTLSSGIAHDFNNILTAIIGNAEFLQVDLPDGSPAGEAVADILAAADRAQRLVAQILTFSRRTETRREVVALTPIVEETLRFLRATTPATITIRSRVEGPPAFVDVDPTQVHQALMNIGTNAAHAIRGETGTIDFVERPVTLVAEAAARAHVPPGAYASLTVRDSGCGIAADVLPRVFDPFYTTRPQGEGTGLGLAVVLGVVQAHGGGVVVSSAEGVGTEVRIYLPQVAAPPPARPSPTAGRPEGRGQRILLIDDEDAIVRSVSLVLRRLGYLVSGHTDPADALEEFEERPDTIDVVVTDLTMPHLTGLDVVRRVRHLRSHMPVLLMSGFINEADRAAAQALGVNAVVDKPLTVETLATEVDRSLAEAAVARRAVPS